MTKPAIFGLAEFLVALRIGAVPAVFLGYTRTGYDWTLRFQPIADALAALPANELILDGEAVVADSRGIPF
jgi:hypothetical protein